MPLKSFFVFIFISAFISSCNFEKKENHLIDKMPSPKIAVADSIMNYPYRNGIWVTIKTTDQNKVAYIIGLETYELKNWEEGFKGIKGHNRITSRVFISPVINDEWILISGYDIPGPVGDNLETFLNELSTAFGEVHYYYSYKTELCIAKSKNGILKRFIRYNEVQNILEKGDKTDAEKQTAFESYNVSFKFNERMTNEHTKNESTFQKKYKHVNYSIGGTGVHDVYLADTIPWPNGKYILKIAELWSLNPKALKETNYISKGLGLYGKTNHKY